MTEGKLIYLFDKNTYHMLKVIYIIFQAAVTFVHGLFANRAAIFTCMILAFTNMVYLRLWQ